MRATEVAMLDVGYRMTDWRKGMLNDKKQKAVELLFEFTEAEVAAVLDARCLILDTGCRIPDSGSCFY